MKNRENEFHNNILDNNQKGSIIGGCCPTEDDFPNGENAIIDAKSFLDKLKDLMIIH